MTDCVNIITRTKDRPILLKRAIESVLGQTHQHWRHILINDGGDAIEFNALVLRYAERYRDRLHIISNPQSLGTVRALNLGAGASEPGYVVVHDDDDSWTSGFLERSISALKARQQDIPATKGIASHCYMVIEMMNDQIVARKYKYSFNGWLKSVRLARMCLNNVIPPISFLFEQDVFSDIGIFDEQIEYGEDWEFYLRFLQQYEIAILPEHLANYHVRISTVDKYNNTITSKLDKHIAMGTWVRNRYIRKDLESGRPGLGHLMAIAEGAFVLPRIRQMLWQTKARFFARLGSVLRLSRD